MSHEWITERFSRRSLFAATLLCLAAAPSQAAAAPDSTQKKEETQPSDRDQTDSLGDRGRKHDGVIKPGDTDPSMEIRPSNPDQGSTPVIPPPGGPEGDPNRMPK